MRAPEHVSCSSEANESMLFILSALSVGIKHVVKTNLLQVSSWSTAAQLFKTSLPQSLSLIMAADRRFSTNGLKSFNGYIKTPFLIGVAGGTASGKVNNSLK